jgi:hypothetical protein
VERSLQRGSRSSAHLFLKMWVALTLDRKIANLTTAIESGAAVAPLVLQLQVRQTERADLLAAMAGAKAVGQIAPDRARITRQVLEQTAR